MHDRYHDQIILSFAMPLRAVCAFAFGLSLIGFCGVTAYLSMT